MRRSEVRAPLSISYWKSHHRGFLPDGQDVFICRPKGVRNSDVYGPDLPDSPAVERLCSAISSRDFFLIKDRFYRRTKHWILQRLRSCAPPLEVNRNSARAYRLRVEIHLMTSGMSFYDRRISLYDLRNSLYDRTHSRSSPDYHRTSPC